MKMKIQNPILPGFHPDPSIVRVGSDYYIATSTFEWYPGVRIYHSRDLGTWELIATPLDCIDKLELRGVEASDGIWAPCLSHDGEKFYLIYTVVHSSHNNPFKDTPNYVVTASNIEGPWSAPHYLNSSGFDPSLFHDRDGRKWFVNMQWDYRKVQGGSQFTGILLQEYCEERLIGEPKIIFKGTERVFTEGPHLYYRNGFYYLICAEGGTAWKHAVTLARSKKIEGPYEVHPENPILTSWEGSQTKEGAYEERSFDLDIGSSYLKKAGHASLCETENGQWVMVHLCSRPLPGTYCCVLGRETAIQEVEWKEDGWLYLKRGGNHPYASVSMDSRLKPEVVRDTSGEILYSFEDESFRKDFQTLRIPYDREYMSVDARKGYLRLTGRESMVSRFNQTLLARRQTDFCFQASTEFIFKPTSFQHGAGLIYRYDEHNQYYFCVSFDEELGTNTMSIMSVCGSKFKRQELQRIEGNQFELGIRVLESNAQFYYIYEGSERKVGEEFDITNLSDDFTYGFTGAFVGICVQDLCSQKAYADFKSFRYKPLNAFDSR